MTSLTVQSYRTDTLSNDKTRKVAVAPDRDCGVCGRPSGLCCTDERGVHAYAVLDAISADGDILDTYDIPHAQAFRFIYRKLRLRVAETDGVSR